jgi:hypothetical protein
LDGTPAAEAVTFGLDGTSYEIDLSKKNAAAFRKALDRYVKAARRHPLRGRPARTPRRSTTPTSRRRTKRGYDLAELREWAGATGVPVPARGRIPQAVVDQYKVAGGR